MTKFLIAATSAIALAAASLGGASAGAAPVEDDRTAAETVEQLETEGYKVIVSKFGSAPLDQCSVESLRSGHDVYEWVNPPLADELVRQVEYTTIYLDARC